MTKFKISLPITLAVTAIAGLAFTASMPAAKAAGYFEGKDVTVLVGLRAGGSATRTATAFTEAWEKNIAGNPNFVVKNMPGGGGITAMNFVYEKAKPDGLTLLWGPWQPVPEALGDSALRAKQGKFHFLGGINDERLNYVLTSVVPGGMKKPADIMKAVGLKTGGNSAAGISDLMARMPMDVLGVPYKHVSGFSGGSGIFAALKRGEVHMHNTSVTSFRTRSADAVKAGEMMGVFYLAYVDKSGTVHKSKYITEMPSFPELYKEIHGKMPSGQRWESLNWLTGLVGRLTFVGFAPPGTPAEAVAELRASFAKACADPSFQQPAIKTYGVPYTCVGVNEGNEIIKSLDDVSPAIIEDFRKVVEAGSKM